MDDSSGDAAPKLNNIVPDVQKCGGYYEFIFKRAGGNGPEHSELYD